MAESIRDPQFARDVALTVLDTQAHNFTEPGGNAIRPAFAADPIETLAVLDGITSGQPLAEIADAHRTALFIPDSTFMRHTVHAQ
jgi:hypothetical protein